MQTVCRGGGLRCKRTNETMDRAQGVIEAGELESGSEAKHS